jgi:hypothetical protein
LFKRMLGAYKGLWSCGMPTPEMVANCKQEWLRVEAFKNLDLKTVELAIDLCTSDRKTPPVPAEFKEYVQRAQSHIRHTYETKNQEPSARDSQEYQAWLHSNDWRDKLLRAFIKTGDLKKALAA